MAEEEKEVVVVVASDVPVGVVCIACEEMSAKLV